jgi:hypothetical protein
LLDALRGCGRHSEVGQSGRAGRGVPLPGCEHTFVSIKGSPYARFRRALETNSPVLVTAAALELPRLTLADALRVCLVYARTDRERFERAIVRWHGRFCLEAKRLDPPTAQLALAAALALAGPHSESTGALLAHLAEDHHLPDVATVLDEWRTNRP